MLTTRYTDNFIKDNKKRDLAYRRITFDDKWTTDESGDEQMLFKHDKDKFIELAQAALEQAKIEEEQKGVFQELLEVFIAQTGAPMVADVILEQFRSQDVIEKIAEDHCERRRSSTSSTTSFDNLKEQELNIIESNHSKSIDTMMIISEYLWRFFRLLLLSSLVCLLYHFMCVDPNQSLLRPLLS